MGVPTITRYGLQPSGRSGASVLTAMGRGDWVANDNADYIDKAVDWAGRTKELADARQTLRQEFQDSPVIKGYVEAVESAYRDVWKMWCKS